MPERCEEVTDSKNVTKIVCEEKKKKECPVIDKSWETKCTDYDGKVAYLNDTNNCPYLDCQLSTKTKKDVLKSYTTCPTKNESKKSAESCEALGGKTLYDKKAGCEFVSCKYKETTNCGDIEDLSPKVVQDIELTCQKKGLVVVKDFDTRGCEVLTCGSDEKYCKSVTADAYTNCKGTMIVKKDDEGCVTFAECIVKGEEKISLEGYEKVTEVPDASVLLEIALKIEDLKEKFIEFAEKMEDIANFYEVRNDSSSKRFDRAAGMFYDAADTVDSIRTTLKENLKDLSIEDVEEIKLELRKIRKSILQDILYILLADDDTIDDIVSDKVEACGSDETCFDKALRVCQLAVLETTDGLKVTTSGMDDNSCILNIEKGDKSMTCKVSKYSKGLDDPENTILPNCEGNLKEALYG